VCICNIWHKEPKTRLKIWIQISNLVHSFPSSVTVICRVLPYICAALFAVTTLWPVVFHINLGVFCMQLLLSIRGTELFQIIICHRLCLHKTPFTQRHMASPRQSRARCQAAITEIPDDAAHAWNAHFLLRTNLIARDDPLLITRGSA